MVKTMIKEKRIKKTIVKDFPPLTTPEDEKMIEKFYEQHPELLITPGESNMVGHGDQKYRLNDPWIQTYTGRRFTPTNPVIEAIVLEDIAHPLSMQCRFSGHTKEFYSVAQHSVLVSYICDRADALWGLLHDASEAYLVDIPRPIKQSGKFDNYLEFEKVMQKAVCKRFGLPEEMPASVKMADDTLLMTEARDLMSPLHAGWTITGDPLPFHIKAVPQPIAKSMFIKRFWELTNLHEDDPNNEDIADDIDDA